MARPPLILVTSIPRSVPTTLGVNMDNATINQRFGELISGAGGIPIASDAWTEPESLADYVDAVVINGGSDVAPERYGAERLPSTDAPDVRRDDFELGLVRAALARGLPVLGVCRGMQILNVALGGTLIQDVASHSGGNHYVVDPYDRPVHDIVIERDSKLGRSIGRHRTRVNTVHRQAVDRLGTGLRAIAWADDGIVEAVEDEEGLVLGVQWHPEFMAGEGSDEQLQLFRGFLPRVRTPLG
jgi:putative glutamine amidotransferase